MKKKLLCDLDNTVIDVHISIMLMKWDRGKSLAQIRTKKLYREMDCDTFEQYLDKKEIFRISAFADIALYECFTERELIKLSKKYSYIEIIKKMMSKRKV